MSILASESAARRPPGPAATLAEWLAWQERLHPKAIELGLERVREVGERLDVLAAPPKTITVAGTNGKGSTAALLAEIYRAAGYRTGLYTSPHLLRYNERIALDGEPAADSRLCEAFSAVEAARRGVPLTYFEFGTLAALWLFLQDRVDVQILEVGLGGRLDAVNIVDCDCAIVTNVGLDHRDWLGEDREAIGFEKAGILRAGRPAVCVDPHPPASIARQTAAVGARLVQLGRDFDYETLRDAWRWRGQGRIFEALPRPGLHGAAQIRNAAGALAAIEAMQRVLPAPEPALREALPKLQLPGRYQRTGQAILDVAHNVEAAEVLVENLRAEPDGGRNNASGRVAQRQAGSPRMANPGFLARQEVEPRTYCGDPRASGGSPEGTRPTDGPRNWFVLGMLNDKPAYEFAKTLAPHAAGAFLAPLPPPRGLSAEALAERIAGSGLHCEVCTDVPAAYARARLAASAGDRVVVCGSFLTVAAVMQSRDGHG